MCGKWADNKIANEKFLPWLGEEEKYLADSGFRGAQEAITPYHLMGEENAHLKRLTSASRARHETANTRLKNWKIIHDESRHDPITQHRPVFDAVAKIIQLEIENGRKLFSLEREMQKFLDNVNM